MLSALSVFTYHWPLGFVWPKDGYGIWDVHRWPLEFLSLLFAFILLMCNWRVVMGFLMCNTIFVLQFSYTFSHLLQLSLLVFLSVGVRTTCGCMSRVWMKPSRGTTRWSRVWPAASSPRTWPTSSSGSGQWLLHTGICHTYTQSPQVDSARSWTHDCLLPFCAQQSASAMSWTRPAFLAKVSIMPQANLFCSLLVKITLT